MKRLFYCVCAVLAVMMSASPSWAKLDVVASFSILGDMVEQVAGDKATVTTIVGPDADAHLYQPNTGDAVAVAEADLVIINGMGFETWSASLSKHQVLRRPSLLQLTASHLFLLTAG